MDQINEQLSRLEELSADELQALRDTIVTEFGSLSEQDLTREVADQMSALGNAATAIKDEENRRESEAAELAVARDNAAALINGKPETSKDDEEVPEEVVEEEDPEEAAKRKKKEKDAPAPDALSVEEASVSEVTEPVVEPEVIPEASASVETPVEAELSATEPTVYDSEKSEEEVEEVVEEEPVVEAVEVEEVETNSATGPEPVVTDVVEEVEEVETPEIDSTVEEETVEDESPSTEEDSEETVTAAANTEGLDIEVPSDRRPVDVKATAAPVTIVAGADLGNITLGSELPNLRAVAQGVLNRRHGMGRTTGGDGEQHTVATFQTKFPEDRTLYSNDLEGNSSKIENVISGEALVAAGGLCAPVEVSYDIFGLGELGRPVRDSLAVFSADRGGIRFVTPPVLTDLDGAVSLWTLQDDIDAASADEPNPVKPCIRVACGDEVTVYTDAIPLCLTFGNMGARAYPELVERHLALGMISHARFAETRLLTRIGALSTAVTSPFQLGAARDFFVAVEEAAAGYRNRYRMGPDSPLRVILPEWFKNALRADLTKQLPGDGDEVTFALAESRINSWFAIRGINVTWTMDGETGQIIGAQAPGALNGFPTNLVWYLFAEGTFLFLDGGTLDLGIVRDSTLNGTNDYKIFLETFEGLAKVGIESLKVTTQLRIAGASAATVDTI